MASLWRQCSEQLLLLRVFDLALDFSADRLDPSFRTRHPMGRCRASPRRRRTPVTTTRGRKGILPVRAAVRGLCSTTRCAERRTSALCRISRRCWRAGGNLNSDPRRGGPSLCGSLIGISRHTSAGASTMLCVSGFSREMGFPASREVLALN